jgi:hypothetical protein
MLDGLEVLTVGGTIGTIFAAVAGTAFTSLRSRLVFGAIVGAWISVAVAVTASGELLNPLTLPVLFALPLLAATFLSAMPRARAVMFEFPAPLIISLNAMRILGFLFILRAIAGQLAGPFPYSAGIGDMITGLYALPVARLVARGRLGDFRVAAWNWFGMLDLIVAVTLGVTSRPGSPLNIIHWGVGSAAITTLPLSLIPLVLVPIYLVGHAIVFAQIRAHAASRGQLEQRPVNA